MSQNVQHISQLIRQYGLNRSPRFKSMLFEAEQGMLREDMAALLLFDVQKEIERIKNFPDFTHPPPDTQEELYSSGKPDIRLGTLAERPDLEFGIQVELPLFMIIGAVAGQGKTTAVRALCKGVQRFNEQHPGRKKSLILFDRKGFDYGDLPEMLGYQGFNTQDGFYLSLEPPPGVEHKVWINTIASIFCARMSLKMSWTTLVSVITWLLGVLNPQGGEHQVWPTFGLVLEVLTRLPDTAFSTKGEYTESLRQALTGFVLASGNTFQAARGFQIERDVVRRGRSAVIFMHQMEPASIRRVLTDTGPCPVPLQPHPQPQG
jgi:hypothetical protein